jgi:hypothetical protein
MPRPDVVAVWPEATDALLPMLEHYQQTKNVLVSYSPKKLGFF